NLAVIPARGGSKGLPGKALRNLNGKPVIAHTIQAALESKCISRVVVSTDDKKIAAVAEEYGAEIPCLRGPELSGDTASLSAAVLFMTLYLEMIEGYFYDNFFHLSPTYPLRTAADIDSAFEEFLRSPYRSLVSIDPLSLQPNDYLTIGEGGKLRTANFRSVCRGEIYRQSSFLSISSRRPNYHMPIVEYKQWIAEVADWKAVITPENKAVDVDTPVDLELATQLVNSHVEPLSEQDFCARLLKEPTPSALIDKLDEDLPFCILWMPQDTLLWPSQNGLQLLDTLKVVFSSSFGQSPIFLTFGAAHQALAEQVKIESWNIPISEKDPFDSRGLPRTKKVREQLNALNLQKRPVLTINLNTPLLSEDFLLKCLRLHREQRCNLATVSETVPHPAWAWSIQGGERVRAYAVDAVGQRQSLEPVFTFDGVLSIVSSDSYISESVDTPTGVHFASTDVVSPTSERSYQRIRITSATRGPSKN
ncbi:MAG: acylneuraminate cytidylyltransferase family protein, partial [Bdellovibrionales bacterium]|nr:acylneuraminate cytidylyltransferase family protein [Bdellovibrionales bacterium]